MFFFFLFFFLILFLILFIYVLIENNIEGYENFSFYRKISLLKIINTKDNNKLNIIISLLYNINQIRNKLAHESQFHINESELESWSLKVLENFNGMKFTNYTFRTKIVHAFSILSKNILEL